MTYRCIPHGTGSSAKQPKQAAGAGAAAGPGLGGVQAPPNSGVAASWRLVLEGARPFLDQHSLGLHSWLGFYRAADGRYVSSGEGVSSAVKVYSVLKGLGWATHLPACCLLACPQGKAVSCLAASPAAQTLHYCLRMRPPFEHTSASIAVTGHDPAVRCCWSAPQVLDCNSLDAHLPELTGPPPLPRPAAVAPPLPPRPATAPPSQVLLPEPERFLEALLARMHSGPSVLEVGRWGV